MSVSSEQTALPSPSRATHSSSTLGNFVKLGALERWYFLEM